MALAQIAFVKALDGLAQISAATPRSTETKTSFATSTQTTMTSSNFDTLEITTDTTLWVAVGTNPTAASNADRLVLAGQTRNFGHIPVGSKVAIIAA